MISTNQYSVSGNISNSSYTSEDSLGDNILEENGRISLAYENLRTIPRRIAEKFAIQTKFLDLSYNNFQNISFLSFFEDLHTLILDRSQHKIGRKHFTIFAEFKNIMVSRERSHDITKIS